MTVDLGAAADFLAGSARQLDRRRFEVLFAGGSVDPLFAAVEAYRNSEGGYGWGLEPDLRSRSSQPGGALHAFEAFADAAPTTSPRAVELCEWLASVTLPDGGLPFALPVPDPAACAPFWATADSSRSSLQITAITATAAYRVAAFDPLVAGHPWLARATQFCLTTLGAMQAPPHAMELAFAVQLLDAAAVRTPGAADLLDRIRSWVPAEGMLHVDGGADDEYMRPLDLAPTPGGPARALLADGVAEADVERLAAGQKPDGGWMVDFDCYSPAAALEWRGHRTVGALLLLRDNGVV